MSGSSSSTNRTGVNNKFQVKSANPNAYVSTGVNNKFTQLLQNNAQQSISFPSPGQYGNPNLVHGQANFTTVGSFTFTVPAGVSLLYITATGPGGGGGGGAVSTSAANCAASGGGGGGAGNSIYLQSEQVSPGDVITIIVPAGGTGGAGVSNQVRANGSVGSSGAANTTITNGTKWGISLTAGGYGGAGTYAFAGTSFQAQPGGLGGPGFANNGTTQGGAGGSGSGQSSQPIYYIGGGVAGSSGMPGGYGNGGYGGQGFQDAAAGSGSSQSGGNGNSGAVFITF